MTIDNSKNICNICESNNDQAALFCGICGNKINLQKPNNKIEASLQEEFNNEVRPNLQDEANNERKPIRLGSAIKLGFKNFFNFNGRSTRAEYWWWALFWILSSMIPFIGQFMSLVLIIPSISLTTRRLHDIGKTGWWQLWIILLYLLLFMIFIVSIVGGPPVWLICFILFLILTIWWIRWMATKGNFGPNKFGPDSKYY